MSERDLANDLMIRLSKVGARLFRQNTGMGWAGKLIRQVGSPGKASVTLSNARPLHAGLCKGSSDLIGWTPVEITPAMVGKTIAVFTAIELKTGNAKPTEEQGTFLDAVHAAGGIARVARSPDDADRCGWQPL